MDARRMSGLVVPTQHLGVIHAMWRERGEDMPVAVAMTFSADWPAEIQERVLERWPEYGYRP